MTACSLLYITVPDKPLALHIGHLLVQERLVACVNIYDRVTSIYEWQGKLEEGNEAVIIAKTRADKVEAVIARVKELHPYECPGIIALPIAAGNPEFLQWIGEI